MASSTSEAPIYAAAAATNAETKSYKKKDPIPTPTGGRTPRNNNNAAMTTTPASAPIMAGLLSGGDVAPGEKHWLVEEAERRRIAENYGIQRPAPTFSGEHNILTFIN